MSKLWDTVTGGLSMADLCISGLRTIGSVLEDEVSRDPAEVVRLVRHVWDRVKHALANPTSKADIMLELGGLRGAMTSIENEVDAVIAAKPK